MTDPLVAMPHKGAMLLLEEVLSSGPEHIRCRARACAARHALGIEGRLHTLALVELGAQAAAAHAALQGGDGALAGVLLALRDIEVLAPDAGSLTEPFTAEATRLGPSTAAAHYGFRVEDAAGTPVIRGEAILAMEEGA